MKFCIISKSAFNEAIGGAEIQCKYIAEELIKRGHRVYYIYISYLKKESYTESGIRFEPIYIPIFAYRILNKFIPLKLIFEYIFLSNAMKKTRADYWYCRAENTLLVSIASLKNRVGGKLIYALSNDQYPKKKYWIEKFGYYFYNKYKISLNSVNYFIFQKYSQKSDFYNQYLFDGIVIYNGHPINQNITKVNRLDSSSSPLRLIWIGNLKEIKRPELFIELVEKLQNPLIEFCMVGKQDNQYQDLINEIFRKYKNFHFYDQVDNFGVLEMISSSYLTICTSFSEGFPNVFIESWQFGVPVISLIDPDGLIEKYLVGFFCKDVNDMIEKINYLMKNPAVYQKLSDNSSKLFQEHLRIDKNVNCLLKYIGE